VWRIQTILDPLLTFDNILKNIVSLNSNRFIVSLTNYNTDLKKLIDHTNKVVHYDLDQFNIVSNQNKDCLVFSRGIYAFEIFNGQNLLDNESNYTII